MPNDFLSLRRQDNGFQGRREIGKLRKPIIYEVLRFTNGLSSNLIMIERHTCYFELFSYMVHCYLIKKNFKRCLICYKDSLHEKLHTRSLLKKSQFNSL